MNPELKRYECYEVIEYHLISLPSVMSSIYGPNGGPSPSDFDEKFIDDVVRNVVDTDGNPRVRDVVVSDKGVNGLMCWQIVLDFILQHPIRICEIEKDIPVKKEIKLRIHNVDKYGGLRITYINTRILSGLSVEDIKNQLPIYGT